MAPRRKTPKNEVAIARATKLARALAERLRARRGMQRAEPHTPRVLFPIVAFGWVDEKIADLYGQCVDALDEVHGKNPNTRLVGAQHGQQLLRDLLVRVFPAPRSGTMVPRKTFERRLSDALSATRKSLRAPPQDWSVSVRVDGFQPSVLPFELGVVRFEFGTVEKGAELAKSIADLDSTPKMRRHWKAPHTIEKENAIRGKARAELAQAFTGGAVASLTVRAGDKDAAERLGTARVREALDVVNFFSSFLNEPRNFQGRAYCAPDGPREPLVWLIRPISGAGMTWRPPGYGNTPVFAFDISSQLAQECGLTRVHQFLCDGRRTDLQQRILTGLSWAGRAKVEFRREQAFVLYAIAIESLLAKPGGGAGVMSRVPLRLTHLLGGSLGHRKDLKERIERLYPLRNAIVHSGDATELQDADLVDMQDLANRALTSMVLHPPYLKFRSVQEFEAWLDEQSLGGQTTDGTAATSS